jgi:hypothetical protein
MVAPLANWWLVQELLEVVCLLQVQVLPWLWVGSTTFILFIFNSELGGEGAVVEALPQVWVEHEMLPLPAHAAHCCCVMQWINVGQHEQYHLIQQLLHLLLKVGLGVTLTIFSFQFSEFLENTILK